MTKGTRFKLLSVITIVCMLINIIGYIPVLAVTTSVTISVKDVTGPKDSFTVSAANPNKFIGPTILQGQSFMNVDMTGDYNYYKYQFIKQTDKPVNIPSTGWQNLDINYQQTDNNDDVMTDKSGYLTWRSYDVNHLPTISNQSSWQNRDLVFKYPIAATDYKSTNVSLSWTAYGKMTSIVPYNVTTVDNKVVTVNEKWVSNSMFMTSHTYSSYDLPKDAPGSDSNYKEASKFWGYLKVPTTGTYYFGIRSDDGSVGSLTVGGTTTKFTDMFLVQGSTWGTTGKAFNLVAGKYYPIYLEYFNWGGGANFEMRYSNSPFTSISNTTYGNPSNSYSVPNTWFYPSKNNTPGEYSNTVFTGSNGVQFPTAPGDYYVAYQTGKDSTIGAQGFYGPFSIEGNTSMTLSKSVTGGSIVTEKKPFTLNYTITPPATIAATNNFKNADGTFKSTLSISNIKLQDAFPNNISITSTSNSTTSVTGQTVQITLPSITYNYVNGVYQVNSSQAQLTTQLTLTPTDSGNYTLSSAGNSQIIYLDVNTVPTNGQTEFPALNIKVLPVAPAITVPSSGSTTNNNKPTISGTCETNTTITVYIDGIKVGTTTGTNGTWSYSTTTALSDGTHTITADATDTSGNTSTLSSPVSVTINTGKPALGSVTIRSNNSNTAYAKVGDTVTLSFKEVNGAVLGSTTVSIAGHSVTAVIGSGNIYTATYTMTSSDSEGIVPFTIDFTNYLNTTGTRVNSPSDGKNVIFDRTNPVLSSVNISSNNQNNSYAKIGDKVTLNFTSKEVLPVAPLPVVTIAGHAVTPALVNGNSYTASYIMTNSDTEGIVPFTIDFCDLAGNVGSTVSISTDGTTVNFDRTSPIPTISYSSNPAKAGQDTITVKYSEPLRAGDIPQITIKQQGTNNIGTQNMEMGADRSIWTFIYTVNPDNGSTYKDGLVTVSLSSVSDEAGNVANSPTGNTFTIDTLAPTVTIGQPSAAYANVGPITFTINYIGADVITLNNSDITLVKTGTADGSVTVSGTGSGTRTVTINNMTGDGTLGIKIGAGTASDNAGNLALAPNNSSMFTVDNTKPKVNITYSANPACVGTNTIMVTYSEPLKSGEVPQVAVDQKGTNDISFTNMTPTSDNKIWKYNYIVNPASADGVTNVDGLATVTLSTVHDVAGNDAEAPTGNTFTIITKSLTVELNFSADPTKASTDTDSETITAKYSEPVKAGETPQISINQQGTDDVVSQNMTLDGTDRTKWVYKYTVHSATQDGKYVDGKAIVSLSTVHDEIGNVSIDPSVNSFTIDTTAPTIKSLNCSPNPAKAGITRITVEYSEPIKTGETPQITINQPGTVDVINANMVVGTDRSIWTYDYLVNPQDGDKYIDGTANVSLSFVDDMAGNTISTPGSTTFTIDTTAPTITIGNPSLSITNNGPITFTINYNGATNITLDNSDITLIKDGPDSDVSGTISISGTGNNTRIVTISNISGNGKLGIRIAGGTASDDAGNLAVASGDSQMVIVDNISPIINTFTSDANNPIKKNDQITFTVNFSEEMKFAPTINIDAIGSDVDIISGAMAQGSDGKTWTYVWIVPSGHDGNVNISVNGMDLAGNQYVHNPMKDINLSIVNFVIPSMKVDISSQDTNEYLTVRFISNDSNKYTMQYSTNGTSGWTNVPADSTKQFSAGTVVYTRETDDNRHYSNPSAGLTIKNMLKVNNISSLPKDKLVYITVYVNNNYNGDNVDCQLLGTNMSKYVIVKKMNNDASGNAVFRVIALKAGSLKGSLKFIMKDNDTEYDNIYKSINIKTLPQNSKGIM